MSSSVCAWLTMDSLVSVLNFPATEYEWMIVLFFVVFSLPVIFFGTFSQTWHGVKELLAQLPTCWSHAHTHSQTWHVLVCCPYHWLWGSDDVPQQHLSLATFDPAVDSYFFSSSFLSGQLLQRKGSVRLTVLGMYAYVDKHSKTNQSKAKVSCRSRIASWSSCSAQLLRLKRSSRSIQVQ